MIDVDLKNADSVSAKCLLCRHLEVALTPDLVAARRTAAVSQRGFVHWRFSDAGRFSTRFAQAAFDFPSPSVLPKLRPSTPASENLNIEHCKSPASLSHCALGHLATSRKHQSKTIFAPDEPLNEIVNARRQAR